MKKIISLTLVLILALSLFAGCGGEAESGGGAGSNGSGSDGGASGADGDGLIVVNIGIPVDIPSLTPFYTTSMGGLYVNQNIYQYLIEREEFGGEFYPMLAKEFEVSDDQMSATATLYDYIYDSAGNHITAEDVVFSYETVLEGGTSPTLSSYLDSVVAIDEYTVEFTLKSTALYRIYDVLCGAWIVSKDAYDENTFITAPIGTGPYKVDEYISGTSLRLVRNENYWQDPELDHIQNRHVADVINYKIILESAQLSMGLESGDLDIASNIAFSDLGYFQNENYTIHSVSSNLINNMAFNMSGESIVSDNLALRQAILYAIDSEALVEGALNGAGGVLHAWGNEIFGDYNSDWDNEDYYDYNVETAKQKLAEAGYGEGEVHVRILMENIEVRKKAAEMIQAMLLDIGITAEILAYDAALFSTYKYTFDEWDIILDNMANSAAMAPIWGNYFSYNHTSWQGQGVTYFGLHDEQLENLAQTAFSIEGHTPENIDAFHYYVKDNALAYGLWSQYNYYAAQSGIEVIHLNSKLYPVPGAFTFAPDYQSISG